MTLIKVKAAVSANPLVFVPALDSLPEFFFAGKIKSSIWTKSGSATADIGGKGATLNRQTIPLMVAVVLKGKSRLRLRTFGLN